MKNLFIIPLVLMALISFSKNKKLKGEYLFGNGFVAASFDFKNDSVLYASYFSDDGYIVVDQKGIYKIKNRKLIIRYVDEIKISPDCLTKKDSTLNTDSLITLIFHIHDNYESLIGVNVSISDATIGTATDINGTCSLRLNKNISSKILISYIAYKNEEISFDNAYNYKFDICLKVRNEDLTGTKKKYPIKSVRKDSFLAKVWNTKNWERFNRRQSKVSE